MSLGDGPCLAFALKGGSHVARANAAKIATWFERIVNLLQSRGFELQLSTGLKTAGPFTAAAWSRALTKLVDGGLESLGVGPKWERFGISGLELAYRGFYERISGVPIVEISFATEFSERPPLTEAEFVDLSLAGAEASGFPQGLLVPARLVKGEAPRFFAGRTQLEYEMMPKVVDFGPRALEQFARGPGWALWLTGGLIEGLGGRERVIRAPVARVVERPSGLWLEATKSPWDFTEEKAAEIEAYLAPVLPTAEQVLAADAPQPSQVRPANHPTAEDEYRDYAGSPVRREWLPTASEGDVDHTFNVHLAASPSGDGTSALERAVMAWYDAGVEEAFPPGGFHYIDGPAWDGAVARWFVDMGYADAGAAFSDLARRLGGWSVRWRCPIEVLRIGTEPP